MLITTSRKVFDVKKTRKIRRVLRKRIVHGKKIPQDVINKLLCSDPKAAHYFTYLSKVLS